ncbi:hypothetical protein BDE02_06G103500 [Populus trichocarpa]|nr:hypothetical protein BDE02_06G103500 [Populus trichocarpa]
MTVFQPNVRHFQYIKKITLTRRGIQTNRQLLPITTSFFSCYPLHLMLRCSPGHLSSSSVPLHLFLLEFFSPLFPCHSLILFSQGTKKRTICDLPYSF